ncbi:MAG: Rv1535 family protein [Mycobacterium sp.]|nr:Rv1535 family protein [Mycobacterium sp.]
MTAVLYDEAMTPAPAPKLTVVREGDAMTAPAPRRETRRGAGGPAYVGDPLVDGASRLLCIPLRHLYAALLRVGLLEVLA